MSGPIWRGGPWTPGVTYRQERDTHAETLRVLLLREAAYLSETARDHRLVAREYACNREAAQERLTMASERHATAALALVLALLLGGDR